MLGIVLIGLGVLGVGIGIQQILLRIYGKCRQGTRYYNIEIESPEIVLAEFFSSADTDLKGCDRFLWGLLDDGLPCAIAYGSSGMIIYPVYLSGSKIVKREGKPLALEFAKRQVRNVWILRQAPEKPAFEVDIQYQHNGKTDEIKIHRFEIGVDASLNFHNFRHFVERISGCCAEHKIGIRDFIRDRY